jgi:hypothetical protein
VIRPCDKTTTGVVAAIVALLLVVKNMEECIYGLLFGDVFCFQYKLSN